MGVLFRARHQADGCGFIIIFSLALRAGLGLHALVRVGVCLDPTRFIDGCRVDQRAIRRRAPRDKGSAADVR